MACWTGTVWWGLSCGVIQLDFIFLFMGRHLVCLGYKVECWERFLVKKKKRKKLNHRKKPKGDPDYLRNRLIVQYKIELKMT